MTPDQAQLYAALYCIKINRKYCDCEHPWSHHREGVGCMGSTNGPVSKWEDMCECWIDPVTKRHVNAAFDKF